MKIVRMYDEYLESALDYEKLCFSEPWTLGMFLSELQNPACTYIAAVEDDVLLGYAGMSEVLDEGNINNLAVAPQYRRRGIGEALINALIGYSARRKLTYLNLEVRPSNEAAIALYEKLGFTRVGLRKGYYTKPKEDAVLMTLLL